jgi:prophage regulatory protein
MMNKGPIDRVMRKPEVLNTVGVSDPTLWRMEKKQRFPKRLKLGPGSVGWFESEVREWLEKKAAERG